MSAGEKISVREKIGYSLGDAASHIVFDSSVAILAYFYTDIYGLPPAVMGTMFLLVRLLDAITDPIMGAIADATDVYKRQALLPSSSCRCRSSRKRIHDCRYCWR